MKKGLIYLGVLILAVGFGKMTTGQVQVSSPIPVILTAGSAVAGQVSINQATGGSTNAVELIPDTDATVAVTQASITANTHQLIKSSAGNVYGWSIYNANSSVCYLQFYNSSSNPTCGTSVTWSFPIPGSATSTIVPPYSLYNHSTGIGFCACTTATGSTACTTAMSGTLLYK